jgi:hypothetical protein
VYRNVHVVQYKKWQSKKQPNPSDFLLRPGESGLSVNWERYCSSNEIFIKLGLIKNKAGSAYLNPKEFKAIIIKVKDIRSIELLSGQFVNVVHKPEVDNRAHAEIQCELNDEEVRLKLCEIVEGYENPLIIPDMDIIEPALQQRRETL